MDPLLVAGWRAKQIEQVPDYAGKAALAEIERQVADFPPLVIARFPASPGTGSATPARPALMSSRVLRGALFSVIAFIGSDAPFADTARDLLRR